METISELNCAVIFEMRIIANKMCACYLLLRYLAIRTKFFITLSGCFGIYVLVVGGIKSLGVLMVEIRDRFDDISAKQMGLVQGLTYTLMMGLGEFDTRLDIHIYDGAR